MKFMHWLAVALGGLVTGLSNVEADLPPSAAPYVKVVLAVCGVVLPILTVTSPQAFNQASKP